MRKMSALALCALLFAGGAQSVELQKVVQDTQRVVQAGNQMTMVLWMPQAFWDASLANNPAMTPEARTEVLALLEEYSIFAVVRAKPGAGGGLEASSRDDLQANARFEIGGKVIEPLAPEAIKPGAQVLLAELKPGFATMLGSLGQSMELLVYPNRQDGKRLLDEHQPGGFRFTLYDQSFTWRLPLPSLLPPRFDPKTSEEFPGNYDFNPYTGGKLQTRK